MVFIVPERQYSIIQRECLAVVYALKQFRDYLLCRRFKLITDHAPLQWLSAQKMEGMLCRWALAMQEYDFQIVHRKGSLNTNADALSRLHISPCAVTLAIPDYYRYKLLSSKTPPSPKCSKPNCTLLPLPKDSSGISNP